MGLSRTVAAGGLASNTGSYKVPTKTEYVMAENNWDGETEVSFAAVVQGQQQIRKGPRARFTGNII